MNCDLRKNTKETNLKIDFNHRESAHVKGLSETYRRQMCAPRYRLKTIRQKFFDRLIF